MNRLFGRKKKADEPPPVSLEDTAKNMQVRVLTPPPKCRREAGVAVSLKGFCFDVSQHIVVTNLRLSQNLRILMLMQSRMDNYDQKIRTLEQQLVRMRQALGQMCRLPCLLCRSFSAFTSCQADLLLCPTAERTNSGDGYRTTWFEPAVSLLVAERA